MTCVTIAIRIDSSTSVTANEARHRSPARAPVDDSHDAAEEHAATSRP